MNLMILQSAGSIALKREITYHPSEYSTSLAYVLSASACLFLACLRPYLPACPSACLPACLHARVLPVLQASQLAYQPQSMPSCLHCLQWVSPSRIARWRTCADTIAAAAATTSETAYLPCPKPGHRFSVATMNRGGCPIRGHGRFYLSPHIIPNVCLGRR